MSLRNKVVGTLLGVFIVYVLAAWLVLSFIYTPAFDKLEQTNSTDQLQRVQEFIELERSDVDLLVSDWAEWDDTMLFAKGEYDEYIDENLSDAYLAELGISFGAFLNDDGELVWGESYLSGGRVSSIDYLLPGGVKQHKSLLTPLVTGEPATGLLETAQGLAIVSSASILWSSGEGPSGGLMLAGRLLDKQRLASIGHTVLSEIEVFSLNRNAVPEKFQQALERLSVGEQANEIVRENSHLYSLKILKDIGGENLALLSVKSEAKITDLGHAALNMTILTLIIAATVVTATLWFVLNGALLQPIECLTSILRGDDVIKREGKARDLVATVRRLSDSRGSISKRNDEIGELINAFDDLSSSLKDATTSVWRIAHLDGLTGLANRRLVMESMGHAMEMSSAVKPVAVLFIDLDDFKIVNDELGHEVGDKLLVDVANRIQEVVGVSSGTLFPEDSIVENLVGRIGSDEFVVLLSSEESVSNANTIAASIVDSVAELYSIDSQTCVIGACVGLAVCPDDANSLSELLGNADAAMYDAKKAGKNTWRKYVPGLTRNNLRKSA